ncbi:hypothetical protein SBA4_6720015 [Candidatus Sulfopaludibacter sp. SbA4]|nr:hypothetical protein SBA4_6720015 [Candidatus Sulfopaludibacter sp. SbA4]
MEIRILTPDDAPAYRALRLEALEREPEAFSSSPEDHRRLSLDEVRARLGSDPAERFTMAQGEHLRRLRDGGDARPETRPGHPRGPPRTRCPDRRNRADRDLGHYHAVGGEGPVPLARL